jgi:hypothetical protein
MKKQLLIAAVAATMGTAAMADLSITGNGKFEYFNSQTGTAASTNTTNTEVNLGFVGKSGDTTVVMNMEFNTHGDVSATDTDTVISAFNTTTGVITSDTTGVNGARGHMDIEDMYLTTKLGDISVKAGNYASGTSGILGEIDNGGRATNKVTLSTTYGGVDVYVGNSGAVAGAGQTAINNNMFAGASMTIAGVKVQAKKVDEDTDAFGISGDLSGVSYRLEQKSDTAANGDVTFGQVSGSTNGVNLSYAWLDADKANMITEDDSAIFAVESNISTSTGNSQISASTSIAGNTVTVKSGSVEKGIDATTDLDYLQIMAVRSLASGATATVTYTDKEATSTTDTETLEIDLSVKF